MQPGRQQGVELIFGRQEEMDLGKVGHRADLRRAVAGARSEARGGYLLRFHTESVRFSPGLLVKSVGRSASGAAKQYFTVSPSNS